MTKRSHVNQASAAGLIAGNSGHVTMTGPRTVRAARGTELTARSWQTEAPLRMLMYNLDAEVAERPDDLVDM